MKRVNIGLITAVVLGVFLVCFWWGLVYMLVTYPEFREFLFVSLIGGAMAGLFYKLWCDLRGFM